MLQGSQPIKWHGGKYYLANWIISHFPPHLAYVEPFFGAGAVLFARDSKRDWFLGHPECDLQSNGKPKAHHAGASEVINDINGELSNFWRCLQDDALFSRFLRRIESTPFSEVEWAAAKAASGSDRDNVERAVQFFIRYRQSRQGLGKDFATLTRNRTRRGRNEQVSAWLSAVEGLPEAHERLRNVVILNRDAVEVIRSQDGPYVLFYCDPPYLLETRTVQDCYEHEMSNADHERLLKTLREVHGKVILSGYRNAIYDQSLADWNSVELEIDNKSGSGKTKQKRREILWMNF
jgi:DNA adenine methylase